MFKDGHLYGMLSFKKYGDGPLKCVDIATGEIKWEQEGFGAGNVIRVGTIFWRSPITASSCSWPIPQVTSNWRSPGVAGNAGARVLADGRIYVRSTKEGAAFDVK